MPDWFLTRGAEVSAAPRVFCFPYAGGNPRVFLDWQAELAADAEIVAVCPPGRAHRIGEQLPPIVELFDAAAAAIRAAVSADGRPVYLFGHSLGGLVAFEVARRLADLPALRHLVVSGISAPSLLPSKRVRELAALDGREFVEALRFFGGTPPELLDDEDVLELLLPGLIAEFRMAAEYRYRRAEPLEIGGSIIVGRDDPHVRPAQLDGWRDEFRTPPAHHQADGEHFYFDGKPAAVTTLLRALVQADQHVELI